MLIWNQHACLGSAQPSCIRRWPRPLMTQISRRSLSRCSTALYLSIMPKPYPVRCSNGSAHSLKQRPTACGKSPAGARPGAEIRRRYRSLLQRKAQHQCAFVCTATITWAGALLRGGIRHHRLRGEARQTFERAVASSTRRCATWRGCCGHFTMPPTRPSSARYRGSPRRLPSLEPWARFWYTWVSVAFLKAYLAVAKDEPFLPKDSHRTSNTLDAYLLAKAVYELGYELNNRPIG